MSATSGYAGIQADNEIVCDLLRAGDAWAYEPYECFDVVYPDGVRTSFGADRPLWRDVGRGISDFLSEQRRG